MRPLVVDADVWVSAADPTDSHSASSRVFLQAVMRLRQRVVIPALAQLEVACALSRRLRSAAQGLSLAQQLHRSQLITYLDLDPLLAAALELGTGALLRRRLAVRRGRPKHGRTVDFLGQGADSAHRRTHSGGLVGRSTLRRERSRAVRQRESTVLFASRACCRVVKTMRAPERPSGPIACARHSGSLSGIAPGGECPRVHPRLAGSPGGLDRAFLRLGDRLIAAIHGHHKPVLPRGVEEREMI